MGLVNKCAVHKLVIGCFFKNMFKYFNWRGMVAKLILNATDVALDKCQVR